MERTPVQKLARVLRVLVIITLVCKVLALLLVPMMAYMYGEMSVGEMVDWGIEDLTYLLGVESTPRYYFPFAMMFFCSWLVVWTDVYMAVLTVFLWICGICTAIILWQAKRVLDTILKGNPFTLSNAVSLKRAAVCCFVISGAALIRLIWGFVTYQSILPLLTYNALFVPVFLMAGLVCMVMSALFRQAAEIKAENDLTI